MRTRRRGDGLVRANMPCKLPCSCPELSWMVVSCTGTLLTREKEGRMREEEAEKKMTKRIEVARAPAPLEEYVKHFDALFGKSNQREGFRRYVEGLLLPSERHKTLTGLMNTEPVVGAQLPRAQALQWFLSEADWDERKMQASRLQLLREEPTTAPTST